MKKILLITILIMLGFSFLTVKVNANITDVIFTANTIGSQTTQGDDTAGKGGTHWVVTLNFNNNTPLLQTGDKLIITFPTGFNFNSSTISITTNTIGASFGTITKSSNVINIPVTGNQTSAGQVVVDITNAINRIGAGKLTGIVDVKRGSSNIIHTTGEVKVIPDLINKIVVTPNPYYTVVGDIKNFIAESFDVYGNKRTRVNSIYGWEDKFDWSIIQISDPDPGNAVFTTSNSNVDNVTIQTTDWGHIQLKAQFPPGGAPYTHYGIADIYIISQISTPKVDVDPPYAGSVAEYNIRFNLGPNGSVVGGVDYILITFPNDTFIPFSFSYLGALINGYPVSITYVSVRTVKIVFPYSLPAGAYVIVTFPITSGITNPSTSGTYTLNVSTSKEPTPVTSNPYTIYYSVISRPKVTVEPNVVDTEASYTIEFKTGSAGNLTKDYDVIAIKFPDNTYIPSIADKSEVTINGVNPKDVTISTGRKIQLKVPVNISNNSNVKIIFTENFGIKNPTEGGDYTLQVATSREPTYVTSYSYKIVESVLTDLVVEVNPPVTKVEAEYKIGFKTGKHGALSDGDEIYIKFPSYTKIPNDIDKNLITINRINLKKNVVIDSSNKTITIKTPVKIGNEESVEIIISKDAGIKNPDTPGEYKLKAWTEKEKTEVTSSPYKLIESILTSISTKVIPPSIQRAVSFEIKLKTGPGGSLNVNDYIYIKFPQKIDIPQNIKQSSITIKGISLTKTPLVSKDKLSLTIQTPVPIGKEEEFIIFISQDANIKILEEGEYYLTIYTSKEPNPINTKSFLVYPMPETKIILSIPEPDGLNGYYKTTPVITFTSTSKYDKDPQVFFRWDNGPWTEYRGLVTPPEGIHTIYYYAKDKLGSEEEIKEKTFKLDTTLPKIINLNIFNDMYINKQKIEISGVVSEISSVLIIQGRRVSVNSDGSFKVEIELFEGINNISFVLIDFAGNEFLDVVKVIRDTIPPELTIEYPVQWITVNDKIIEIRGKAEIGGKLTLNGEEVLIREDGKFEGSIELKKSGTNVLDFVLVDKAGNVTRQSIGVIWVPRVKIELTIGKIEAKVNEYIKILDYPPFIFNGRTMVPLRFIGESIGAVVDWDSVVRIVTITLEDSSGSKKILKLSPDSTLASLNGIAYEMDTPPVIRNDRVYVPIRFIMEAFGAKVEWNSTERRVLITYPGVD
ncbi:MAG TPA: stalk domain-containing protein [Caldisericia bacterium]|nr:stalk domain-containing protein [Caldisericia bacterium]HOL83039.1 stalk domain-containing protein [Caldisericia bacterium]